MAKKSFKKGIGSLINDSFSQREADEDANQGQDTDDVQTLKKQLSALERQLKLQSEELWKWRTGELTPQKFHDSLKKHQLRYNADDNTIEKDE